MFVCAHVRKNTRMDSTIQDTTKLVKIAIRAETPIWNAAGRQVRKRWRACSTSFAFWVCLPCFLHATGLSYTLRHCFCCTRHCHSCVHPSSPVWVNVSSFTPLSDINSGDVHSRFLLHLV